MRESHPSRDVEVRVHVFSVVSMQSKPTYLPRLAELLVLPLFGRAADFHRIDTRALLGAQSKTARTLSHARAILGWVEATFADRLN